MVIVIVITGIAIRNDIIVIITFLSFGIPHSNWINTSLIESDLTSYESLIVSIDAFTRFLLDNLDKWI